MTEIIAIARVETWSGKLELIEILHLDGMWESVEASLGSIQTELLEMRTDGATLRFFRNDHPSVVEADWDEHEEIKRQWDESLDG